MFGKRSVDACAVLALTMGTALPATAVDRHTVTGLDPTRTYNVVRNGTVVVSAVQPDPTGRLMFTAERGSMQIVATGSGDVTPPSGVTDLVATTSGTTAIQLGWTAPGDDGGTGTAAAYEIRWATTPGGLSASPSIAQNPPAPSPAGAPESFLLAGLPEGTTIYVALRARDDAGLWGPLSNAATATTDTAPDTTPPSTITDVAAIAVQATSVTLAWTSPGDDGTTGTAEAYEIRYATTQAGLDTNPVIVPSPPAPQPAGTSQAHTISGLESGRTYFFRLRARDDAGQWSGPSNVASATTPQPADVTPPADVNDLAIVAVGTASVTIRWTAPGDDGNTGTAAAYEVRWATSPTLLDVAPHVSSMPPTPGPAGTTQQHVVNGLPASTTLYFAVVTVDDAGLWSDLSNVASATTDVVPDTAPPSPVNDLTIVGADTTALTIQWTAPGDDGTQGIASLYDIRWATDPASLDSDPTFDETPPAPSEAGSVELHELNSLPMGTTVYVAIRARDEAGNWSDVSNVVNAQTLEPVDPPPPPPTDDVPPAEIMDLTVDALDVRWARLSWSETGDDGTVGTPTRYVVRYAEETIHDLNFSQMPMATGIVNISNGRASIVVTGLTSNTDYFFAVVAYDESGNRSTVGPNAEATTLPEDRGPVLPPPRPTAEFSTGTISLRWEAPPDPFVVGYHVYRQMDGDVEIRQTTDPVTDVRYADASVTEGMGYTYRVSSVNDLGDESPRSDGVWLRAALDVPRVARVDRIYPNPVRGQATFRIAVPEVGPGGGARVTIDLFDVSGKRIVRVCDDLLQPGAREVVWSVPAGVRFAPGLYTAVLRAGSSTARAQVAIAPR